MALAFAQKSKKPASLQAKRGRGKKQAAGLSRIEQAQFAVGFSHPARTSLGAPMIQTKLKIGEPDDQYEKEADRVADAVMRMPDPMATSASANTDVSGSGKQPGNGSLAIQRKCTDCAMEEGEKLQRKPLADNIPTLPRISALNGPVAAHFPLTNVPSVIQRQEMGEEEYDDHLVQMKSAEGGSAVPAVMPGVEAGINSLKGGGQPLSASTRVFFEPRFGVNFSQVRVHTGGRAAQVTKSVQAKAFTTGRDIVFGAGEHSPDTSTGRKLLAHELTHVVQQSGHTLLKTEGRQNKMPETNSFLPIYAENSGLSHVVQRQETRENENSEEEVVKSVIQAMEQSDPIAGASNIDNVFRILNSYSLCFLTRVLAKVYDQGYFHGLLGYLAPGTKAKDEVVIAIRFIQCRNESNQLSLADLKAAEKSLHSLISTPKPSVLKEITKCFQTQRQLKEKELAKKRAGIKEGPKQLSKGTMNWRMVPLETYSRKTYRGQPSARIQIEFTPKQADKQKTITFLQTVLQATVSSGSTTKIPLLDIGKKDPFEPFYGADFSITKKKWVAEGAPAGYQNAPSSAAQATAYLYDQPSVPPTQVKTFESVAVVLETGEALGALQWGVQWASQKAQILGGEEKNCVDTPSSGFRTAIERFYATPKTVDVTKRRTIGEEHFDAILDGFTVNEASLTTGHKKQLDPIVEQLKRKKFHNLKVKIGGFATASETNPFGVSKKRAELVKQYLLDQGVAKNKIETLGFGATWARSSSSAKAHRNRRVQILLTFR